jgi:hypothetical protein
VSAPQPPVPEPAPESAHEPASEPAPESAHEAARAAARDRASAQRDLAFIREVVARAQRRIDPHAFHFVHWGAIVLVWYPAGNAAQQAGRLDLLALLGGLALLLGFGLSLVRELRLRRRPRLAAQEAFVARQVQQITFASIAAGILLSALGPASGVVEGPDVPIVWGLVYATMSYMTGVVYERDFRVAGVAIFAGTLLAMVFRERAGYILGPCMGLGMIVPGLRAERRVRRLEAAGAAGTGPARLASGED